MHKLIYLSIIAIGFIIPFITMYLDNKNRDKIKNGLFFELYFIFMCSFILSSKAFWMLSELNVDTFIRFITSNELYDRFKFILSGYSFLGGYAGGFLGIVIFSKILKIKVEEVLNIFVPNLTLMYGILKIGCEINGCCRGINDIHMPIIESFVALTTFIILKFVLIQKAEERHRTILYIILFAIIRVIVNFFRDFDTIFCFSVNQALCVIVLSIGIILLIKQKNTANK